MLLTTASVHGACAVLHLLLFTAIPCVCRWCVRRVSAPPCCSPQPACTEPVPFRTYCFLRLFPVFVGGVCGGSAPHHAAHHGQRARSRCRFAPTSLSLLHLFSFPVFEGGVCGWAAPKYHAAHHSQRARSLCRFAPTAFYGYSLCL